MSTEGWSRRRMERRAGRVGGGGLAAALASRAIPAQATRRGPGRGSAVYSKSRLAPALQLTRHCRLAGIVTGTPAKAKEWQERYRLPDRNIYSYDNFASIADNPDIDVVYVVLPNSLHAKYTIAAAEAGTARGAKNRWRLQRRRGAAHDRCLRAQQGQAGDRLSHAA